MVVNVDHFRILGRGTILRHPSISRHLQRPTGKHAHSSSRQELADLETGKKEEVIKEEFGAGGGGGTEICTDTEIYASFTGCKYTLYLPQCFSHSLKGTQPFSSPIDYA